MQYQHETPISALDSHISMKAQGADMIELYAIVTCPVCRSVLRLYTLHKYVILMSSFRKAPGKCT